MSWEVATTDVKTAFLLALGSEAGGCEAAEDTGGGWHCGPEGGAACTLRARFSPAELGFLSGAINSLNCGRPPHQRRALLDDFIIAGDKETVKGALGRIEMEWKCSPWVTCDGYMKFGDFELKWSSAEEDEGLYWSAGLHQGVAEPPRPSQLLWMRFQNLNRA